MMRGTALNSALRDRDFGCLPYFPTLVYALLGAGCRDDVGQSVELLLRWDGLWLDRRARQ